MYQYEKEFRLHISRHPQRSWVIILQQVWNLKLCEKLRHDHNNDSKGKFKSKEICKRFNRGKCPNGMSCKYEHRCLNCGKFGHGEHICRAKNNNAPRNQAEPLPLKDLPVPTQESSTQLWSQRH